METSNNIGETKKMKPIFNENFFYYKQVFKKLIYVMYEIIMVSYNEAVKSGYSNVVT